MALNKLLYDVNFFSRKDNIAPISALDLDNKFNEIVNYINKEIIYNVNDLIIQQFKGSDNPLLLNYFFVNTGLGNATWQKINNNNFIDYTLSLSKIMQYENKGLLFVNHEQILYTKENILNNQCLLSANEELIYGYITNDYIADNSIQGQHIQLNSITNNNIDIGSINIPDNSITTIAFQDSIFNTNHFNSNSDADKISATQINIANFATCIYPYMIPNDYFDKLLDVRLNTAFPYNTNQVEYERIFNFTSTKYPVNKYEPINVVYVDFTINTDNVLLVKNNSIDAERLHCTVDNIIWSPTDNDILEDGAIEEINCDKEILELLA